MGCVMSLVGHWRVVRHVRAARRIIIANQVFQAADLDSLSSLLQTHAGLQVWFLVDSADQVQMIEAWRTARASSTVFTVLMEIGIAGYRAGCRDHEQALALARLVRRSPALRLAGIECYEARWPPATTRMTVRASLP